MYCTVLLPPGVKPIAVNKYIISYIVVVVVVVVVVVIIIIIIIIISLKTGFT